MGYFIIYFFEKECGTERRKLVFKKELFFIKKCRILCKDRTD